MNQAPRIGVNQSFKRSVENFLGLWGNLKKEGGEKPLKNALYNCLVIVGKFPSIFLGLFLIILVFSNISFSGNLPGASSVFQATFMGFSIR
jgi:hypothetical protein